jgi:RNA polymerase sigma-70 factor (ECF subfamily)
MPPFNPDSAIDLSALAAPGEAISPAAIEQDVLLLFERCGPPLLRYVGSFGLSIEETEDIVQDVFLALFRHLRLGRSRANLNGWLFRVAHNLALKQRQRLRRTQALRIRDEAAVAAHADPAPSAEARMAGAERHQRLKAVLSALPDRDRHCLFLRAEGLTYRDIASALGISLGAVAKSLARSIARLVTANEG